MRLIVFTQKMDSKDGALGFFHDWVWGLSKIAESVSVICLEKGDFNLPSNVTVYSLGKERGLSRFGYIKNFCQYLFVIRGSYDRVFVHMNQEYVLLGGLYWKLKGIPVYMWRNHPRGSIITDIAVALCSKIFYTSTQSFTARFKKSVMMPVGINTGIFKSIPGTVRKKYSVCMVGRVAPIKHIELAIEALHRLVSSGTQVSMTVIGSALPKDFGYASMLKQKVHELELSPYVRFMEAVPHNKLPEIYSNHDLCLNLTDSGSFDKTIVEAAACGTIPLVSNTSLTHLLPAECVTDVTPEVIATSIQGLFGAHLHVEIQSKLMVFAESQSLDALMARLAVEMR